MITFVLILALRKDCWPSHLQIYVLKLDNASSYISSTMAYPE